MTGATPVLPAGLDGPKAYPIGQISIPVIAAAVLRLRQESEFHQTLDGTNNRAAVFPYEMCNAIKAWVALLGAKIEAVDDGSRHLLLGAGQHIREADRFESERYVESLRAHFLITEQVILLLACSQATQFSEIVKIDPGDPFR